jgi:hypothetical protein
MVMFIVQTPKHLIAMHNKVSFIYKWFLLMWHVRKTKKEKRSGGGGVGDLKWLEQHVIELLNVYF